MINIKPILANSKQNKLEYFNAIGLIFQNHIYLNRNNALIQYEIDDIKRVYFKKERNLNQNFFSFITSLIIAFSSYASAAFLGNFKLIAFMVSGCFFLYSFLNKSYNYRILMTTVHQNIISILISPEAKEEASKLVSLIKMKIKKDAQYLKVS